MQLHGGPAAVAAPPAAAAASPVAAFVLLVLFLHFICWKLDSPNDISSRPTFIYICCCNSSGLSPMLLFLPLPFPIRRWWGNIDCVRSQKTVEPQWLRRWGTGCGGVCWNLESGILQKYEGIHNHSQNVCVPIFHARMTPVMHRFIRHTTYLTPMVFFHSFQSLRASPPCLIGGGGCGVHLRWCWCPLAVSVVIPTCSGNIFDVPSCHDKCSSS